MKTLRRLIILFAASVLILQGCGNTQNELYLKAHRMFAELKTYTTTAEIVVRGNKIVENYIVKQYFKYPDRYRLEVLSSGDNKGKITLYDGEGIIIYHPRINQLYIMENVREVEESCMFPGYFAKSLFSSEEASYEVKKDGGNEYIAIKVEIPEGNSYRKWQVLYLDSKTILPVKMEIMDSNENIVVTVFYREFVYNANIEDILFRRESIPSGGQVIE